MTAMAWPSVLLDSAVSDEALALREARAPSQTSLGATLDSRLDELREAAREAAAEGWDGYGARPVSLETFASAAQLLEMIPTTWPSPEISADADGEIWFQWDRGARRVFSVSVGDAGVAHYAGLFGASRVHGREPLGDRLQEIVSANLARIYPEARSQSRR